MASSQPQQIPHPGGLPPPSGSAIRGSSLIRSKSLRLPNSRRSDHSISLTNLTRHASMRLPRPSTSSTSIATVANAAASAIGGTTKKPPPPPIKPKPSFMDRIGEKMHSTLTKNTAKTSSEKCINQDYSKGLTFPRPSSFKGEKEHLMSRSVNIDAPLSAREQFSMNRSLLGKESPLSLDVSHHYKRLTEEHEKLQMEYARLRMQHMDNAASKLLSGTSSPIHPNKETSSLHTAYSDTHLDTIPEDGPTAAYRLKFGEEEKNAMNFNNSEYITHLESLVYGYRAEIIRVQDEARKTQRKYWDQVIGSENNDLKEESTKQVLKLLEKEEEKDKEIEQMSSKIQELQSQLSSCKQELKQCHNALQDYQFQMDSMEHQCKTLTQKLKDAQSDLTESRDSVEFLQAERSALAESLQESELSLQQSKDNLSKEKAAIKDLSQRNRKLFSKLQEKNLQLQLLHADLESTQGRARDMLLSQGAELTMGAVAISHLSSRVHSVLASTMEYAATQLALDKEVHYEILNDFDEKEDDLLGLRLQAYANGTLDSSSEPSPTGEARPTLEVEEKPSPIDSEVSSKPNSLVQSIIEALEQTSRSNGNSTPTSPIRNFQIEKDQSELLEQKPKPVGKATAFRSGEDLEKNGENEEKDKGTVNKMDETSLEGQAKLANSMLNKLMAVLSLVQNKYSNDCKEKEAKIAVLENHVKHIDEQRLALEVDIGTKSAICDELGEKLNSALERLNREDSKHSDAINLLKEKIQELTNECHSLKAMNVEQARQMKEEVQRLVRTSGPANSMGDAMAICDKLVLKQEIVRMKEILKDKDDVLKVLAAKFSRHKKVWEENYQKAEGEVQKLDEVIEKVIEVLQDIPELVSSCQPLHNLLSQLTSGSLCRENSGLSDHATNVPNGSSANPKKETILVHSDV